MRASREIPFTPERGKTDAFKVESVICYLLFVICYLLFVICYLLFSICYLQFFCVHLRNLRSVKNLDTKNKIRFSLIAQINVQLVKNSPPFFPSLWKIEWESGS